MRFRGLRTLVLAFVALASAALGFFSGAPYLEGGRTTLYFNFDGEAIGRNGEDGPYYVTDLLAFGGGASLVAAQVFAAEPFLASQFEG